MLEKSPDAVLDTLIAATQLKSGSMVEGQEAWLLLHVRRPWHQARSHRAQGERGAETERGEAASRCCSNDLQDSRFRSGLRYFERPASFF
jgi:hypothetical protein